jgi:hypothetical protein
MMPRAREYENGAARQAAYRARHREEEPPRQRYLAALSRTLHAELKAAAAAGRSPVPAALITRRADDTLRNLIGYLREAREAEEAAAEARPAGPEEKGGKHR